MNLISQQLTATLVRAPKIWQVIRHPSEESHPISRNTASNTVIFVIIVRLTITLEIIAIKNRNPTLTNVMGKERNFC